MLQNIKWIFIENTGVLRCYAVDQ